MARIERSTDIAAPPSTVWALLEDVRRLPEYSDATDEVRDAPERLTEVGQQYEQVGRVLGMRVTSRWRIEALEPGRMIRSRGTIAPGVAYTLTQHLEALPDDRSRLSIRIDYDVPGGRLGRIAAKAGVEARAGREAQAVLDGLRATAEGAA